MSAINVVLSSLFKLFGFDFQISHAQFKNLVIKFEFEVIKIEFIFNKVLKSMATSFSHLISDFYSFSLLFY